MPNYTSQALFAIIIVQQRHIAYRFIQLVHERDLSRSESDSKQIGQRRAYSFTTFNKSHARHISYSKAIGSSFFSFFDRIENSPQTNSAALLWREGFQWTRNMSQWLREREIIRSPKRFVQKERLFTNVTSLAGRRGEMSWLVEMLSW